MCRSWLRVAGCPQRAGHLTRMGMLAWCGLSEAPVIDANVVRHLVSTRAGTSRSILSQNLQAIIMRQRGFASLGTMCGDLMVPSKLLHCSVAVMPCPSSALWHGRQMPSRLAHGDHHPLRVCQKMMTFSLVPFELLQFKLRPLMLDHSTGVLVGICDKQATMCCA